MLFNYGSGLKDTYIRTGSYLPGEITKTGWKQAPSLNSDIAIEFGQAVKRDVSGAVPLAVNIAASDTAADLYGIAVRDVQSQNQVSYGAYTNSFIYTYTPGQGITVLRKGWIAVPVQNGTPAVGGTVYMRVAANSGNANLPIGGFETSDSSGECVAINAIFESGPIFPMNGTSTTPTASIPTSQVAVIYLNLD